jgi:glycerophosphoryl diester phosphodiesterase
MDIIGHRGARAEAPENTLESIQAALLAGVDMIELDLRLRDSSTVLSHDKLVSNHEYTTLSEALTHIDGKVPINLEIKELQVLPYMAEELNSYNGAVLISSFKFSVLKQCRHSYPEFPIAVLEKWSGVRAVSRARRLGTTRLHMNEKWLWSGFIRTIKKRDWLLYAYTVNTKKRADYLKGAGVDGIFTDVPSRLVQLYRKDTNDERNPCR